MSYQTTITRKGQITIPKEIRELLRLREGRKMSVELEAESEEIRVKPYPDILELAGTFKIKIKKNVLKAREEMEKHYERV